jgi:hypothetical protein
VPLTRVTRGTKLINQLSCLVSLDRHCIVPRSINSIELARSVGIITVRLTNTGSRKSLGVCNTSRRNYTIVPGRSFDELALTLIPGSSPNSARTGKGYSFLNYYPQLIRVSKVIFGSNDNLGFNPE